MQSRRSGGNNKLNGICYICLIFKTTMETKEQYINRLSEFKKKRGIIYGINRIGIFGSVAKGKQTQNSDIDIYYEGRPLSLFKMAALKTELETILNSTVDIVRFRESMNGLLKKNIINDGIFV
jgi:predicted nucleotidyltransferase